jgi:hypothetical protein
MARQSDEKKQVALQLELSRLRKDNARLIPMLEALRDIRNEAQKSDANKTNLRNGWLIQRTTEGLQS